MHSIGIIVLSPPFSEWTFAYSRIESYPYFGGTSTYKKIRILVSYFSPQGINTYYVYGLAIMRTKTLALSLAIGIGVMLATSTSVASVLAQNATNSSATAKNATNSTAGAAVKNATSSNTSSNPLAKIGHMLSKLFGGKG